MNTSKHKLTLEEENCLRLGLRHCIPPPAIDELGIKCAFEKLCDKVCPKVKDNQRTDFVNRLRHLANSYLYTACNEVRVFSNKALHKTLRNLKQNKEIKVCKYDKGNGTVVMDSDIYYEKLDAIVGTDKFCEIPVPESANHHPVIKVENSLQYYLNRYIKTHVEDSIFSRILPSGSRPGALYGLAKVHKANIPLRPVISMTGTAQYHLAKYLDDVIKPSIPATFMLSSTSDFISRIRDCTIPANHCFVSYDVVSLFTNVPLQEVIDIACDYVYHRHSETKPKYEEKHFRKLLCFATQGIFLYKDKLYKQTDGVAMGSPLAPTLANLFLGHLEQEWINDSSSPLIYLRYVDDIFCVFDARNDKHLEFMQFLNTRHPNLTFTCETGPTKLPFLDVMLEMNNGMPIFSVFRKETYTGLLLNFTSYCPLAWKKGLVKCLLTRAVRICSNSEMLNVEIEKLKKYFYANGYPKQWLDKVIRSFFQRQATLNSDRAQDNSIYLCLPYFGAISEKLKQQMLRFARQYSLDIRVLFKPYKISNYFSLKTPVPQAIRSGVIYNFSCLVDPSLCYVGRTKRHLCSRVREHRDPTKNSAISNHLLDCINCTCNLQNFTILRSTSNFSELPIYEALLIKKLRPQLNRNLLNNGASFYLNLF